MEDYCKKNKIYSLKSMRCVNNTMSVRKINNKIYSSNPYNYSKVKELEFLGKGEHGVVYKACFPDIANKCRFTLVKKQDKRVRTSEQISNYINESPKNLIKYRMVYPEVYMMLMCNKLLDKKITQNLPYLYGYKINTNYVSFVSEFANGGDLKGWLLKKTRSKEELDNAYFQIFHSAYCLNSIGIRHSDFHWSNILVFNVKKGGVFKYKIKNKTYYIPNLGYIFIAWDFGLSEFTQKGYLPHLIDDTARISYSSIWSSEEGKKTYGTSPFPYDPETKNIKKPEDIFNVFKEYKRKPSRQKVVDTFTI